MPTGGEKADADPRRRLSADQIPPAAACGACTPSHLLALSDERYKWHRHALAMWEDGYRAAERDQTDDYARGYVADALGRKHAEHQAVEALGLYMRRWEVRDEPRTWETFGQPHPDDYKGRNGAA